MKSFQIQPFIALAMLIISCSEKEPYRLPENAESLLHGDSTKTWKIARRYNNDVRMNMGPCFMTYRQSFSEDHQVSDNNAEMTIADQAWRETGNSKKVQRAIHISKSAVLIFRNYWKQIRIINISRSWNWMPTLWNYPLNTRNTEILRAPLPISW